MKKVFLTLLVAILSGGFFGSQVQAQEVALKSNALQNGMDAFNFEYSDVNGKLVKQSDFKGKVVYIDVWAMWCGPCKREIPNLQILEKEYHGKDIVFVSISIDPVKDHDAWKRFVADREMGGVQLFAGDATKALLEIYDIPSIPRFILVGKDGKIIESKALRPGDEGIRAMLNDALNN